MRYFSKHFICGSLSDRFGATSFVCSVWFIPKVIPFSEICQLHAIVQFGRYAIANIAQLVASRRNCFAPCCTLFCAGWCNRTCSSRCTTTHEHISSCSSELYCLIGMRIVHCTAVLQVSVHCTSSACCTLRAALRSEAFECWSSLPEHWCKALQDLPKGKSLYLSQDNFETIRMNSGYQAQCELCEPSRRTRCDAERCKWTNHFRTPISRHCRGENETILQLNGPPFDTCHRMCPR